MVSVGRILRTGQWRRYFSKHQGNQKEFAVCRVLKSAYSGNREDHPTHSLNDTIKLLECATHSLLVEMHHCKASQYDTYAKLKVFTIQCIKDKVSMHEVSLLDHTKWKSVEKRTCQVPNSWDQRALWVKLFELVATLMVGSCS